MPCTPPTGSTTTASAARSRPRHQGEGLGRDLVADPFDQHDSPRAAAALGNAAKVASVAAKQARSRTRRAGPAVVRPHRTTVNHCSTGQAPAV